MVQAVHSREIAVVKIKPVINTSKLSSLCVFQYLSSFYGRLGDERSNTMMGLGQHFHERNAGSLALSFKSNVEYCEFGSQVAQEYF